MDQYLPLVTLLVLAILFALLSAVASRLLAPSRPNPAKLMPYECGIVPSREPPQRFPVRFYLVAMIFIMFDVEIIFLYPYAVTWGELGMFGFWAIVLFSVIFFVSFLYELAMGGLEWGPSSIERRVDLDVADMQAMVSPTRTTATTIRRVGLEGRPVEAERGGEHREKVAL
jgi:NADH-quinone oxidoreductase subunit A